LVFYQSLRTEQFLAQRRLVAAILESNKAQNPDNQNRFKPVSAKILRGSDAPKRPQVQYFMKKKNINTGLTAPTATGRGETRVKDKLMPRSFNNHERSNSKDDLRKYM
jgi:hypothetical protein